MTPVATASSGLKEQLSRNQNLADANEVTGQLNTMLQMARVKALQGAPQALPNAAWTALAFGLEDTIIVDYWNMHEGIVNPSRFTAPADGLYLAIGQVYITFDSGGSARAIAVKVNGLDVTGRPSTNTSLTPFILNVVTVLWLNYLDYVQFLVFQDSGGALNTNIDSTYGELVLLSRL